VGEGNGAPAALTTSRRLRSVQHAARVASIALLTIAALGASAPAGGPSWDLALAAKDEPGSRFVLEGRVLDAAGHPMHDVLIHVYHADDQGKYHASRLSGMLRTNVLGGYRIRTVLPGIAEGIPHLHVELAGPNAQYRFGTLTLCRDAGAGSDTSFAHLPQMLSLKEQTGFWAYVRPDTARGYRSTWDIPFDSLSHVARPPAFKPQTH
jgi:protocatechuate 3,4-dioxygenase beta subunit